jgi:hypothetical protein
MSPAEQEFGTLENTKQKQPLLCPGNKLLCLTITRSRVAQIDNWQVS